MLPTQMNKKSKIIDSFSYMKLNIILKNVFDQWQKETNAHKFVFEISQRRTSF